MCRYANTSNNIRLKCHQITFHLKNKEYLFNCQLPIHYVDVFYKLLIIQVFLFRLILTRAAANTYAIKGGFILRVHGYIFKPE